MIGATGLVGKNLIKALVAEPTIKEVMAVTRKQTDFNSPKVENCVVDFDNLASYRHVFTGDALFSCLGTTKKQAGSIAAQRVVDVEYQFKAAELAVTNGVSEYFLVSSSGAKSSSTNDYMQMKGELEDKITQLNFKRICIFQPSLLIGQREKFRFGEKLGSWVLPVLCLLPVLKCFKPIYGYQVAAKICQESTKHGLGIQRFTLDECFPDT